MSSIAPEGFRMPRTSLITALAFAAAITGVLAGCTAEPAPAPKPAPTQTRMAPAASGDGVLRIGTQTDAAAGGAAIVAGVELAVREINAGGGVNGAPVEVIHRGVAEAAATDLIARGVDVIFAEIGAESAAAAFVIPISGSESPDERMAVQLAQMDPGISDFTGAPSAYDEVVRIALAAVISADDGATSLDFGLAAIDAGSTDCTSFGECSAAHTEGFAFKYARAL
jgi:branched-chain amino acid transport system substrate-binding protein